MSQQTVTINGVVYDAHTGLPIDQAKRQVTAPSKARPSQAIHQRVQKSQTLSRRHVSGTAVAQTKSATQPAVSKSPMVAKFAPQGRPVLQPQARTISDIGPVPHPVMTKVHKQHTPFAAPVKPAGPKPSQVIKQEAIAEALEKAPTKRQAEKNTKRPARLRKFVSIGSVSLALLLLGGYFTYLNMPNLSVRVAAAQAGVDASYPEYRPDGYSLSGSVAYNQGWVSMKFASNSGPQNFTVKQSKSSWDSSAVLDNYVKEKAGDNYIPYNERGLTIYIYSSNAAWVNDGILYTIEGDAPLSSDQIRRIATSL